MYETIRLFMRISQYLGKKLESFQHANVFVKFPLILDGDFNIFFT